MNYPLRKRGSRAFFAAASFVRIAVAPTFAVSLGLAGAAASAQEVATGSVTGRVLNASNGMYLNKAKVAVEGTNIETLTNDFGEFRLLRIPAGEAKITVTYVGQEPKTVTVNVEAGKAAELNVTLGNAEVGEDGVIKLDPYVVQSERFKNAAEIAINEERYSPNIKNVVAADTFGDIPSGNVGEFVKFIPGVLVDYGATGGANQGTADSDATGINIRGFGAADTSVTIDGMPVSNAFPGTMSRQVYLDTLSINNASRVEVIKVPTPDMPANSVGGSVNLVTRSAFEYAKPNFNYEIYLTANADYISTKETPGPVNKDTRKMQPAATFSVAYPVSKNLGFTVSGSYVPEFKANNRAQMTWGQLRPAGAAPTTEEAAIAYYRPVYSAPFLERYQVTDTPQMTTRTSANLKVDWKPFPGHSLSVNFQGSSYDSVEAARRLDLRASDSTRNPPVVPVTWGSDFTVGTLASNQPRNAMTVTTRDRTGDTKSGYIKYKFEHGGWQFGAEASRSISNSEYADRVNGHFSEVTAIAGGASGTGALQVNFRDIRNGIVGRVETTGNGGAGTAVDTSKLSVFRFDGDVRAKSGEAESRDTVSIYRTDLRRELDFLPFASRVPMALKIGARRDEKKVEKWGIGSNYYEALQTGKTIAFADVIDDRYVGQSPGFGLPAQQWIDTYRLFAIEQQQDLFAVTTEANKIDNWNSYANQQRAITERKDAWYAQIEGRALKGRLSFVGGLRQEKNSRHGLQAFTDSRWDYVKNLDGTVYREGNVGDTYYNGVRFSNASDPLFSNTGGIQARLKALGLTYPTNADGTPRVILRNGNNAATLEGRQMQLQANRPVDQSVKGDPSFSANVAYEITKSLTAKLAWSRTFKQPALEDGTSGLVAGNNGFQYSEFATPTAGADGSLYIGSISMANPGLMPETSQNYDASLSYYFNNGGKVSVSYFWKTVDGQIVNLAIFPWMDAFADVAAAAGYNPAEITDLYFTSSTNSDGKQKTDGIEIEVQQNLGIIGNWGKHFTMFASFTKKSLGDPVSATPIEFNGKLIQPTGQKTITLSANTFAAGGIQFAYKRVSATLRATYRNRNEKSRSAITYTPTGATVATDLNYLRFFDPSETRWDASFDYRITKTLSAFVTGKDIFNNQRSIYREDDLGWIPGYAKQTDLRKFGLEVTLGIRGTF